MPRRVAIVGAGVTGLVAGRELLRRGFAVSLLRGNFNLTIILR